LSLTTNLGIEANPGKEIVDLDAALEALAREDRSLAQLIEVCCFGRMTAEESAEALVHSVYVVRHDRRLAQG
jgi:ECF sigma factor